MELHDFVSETLKEIITGVSEAQESAKEKHAAINPSGTWPFLSANSVPDDRLMLNEKGLQGLVQEVEFNVAVTTAEGASKKGGIGVFVGPVAAGAQGRSESTSSSVSRIRFKVPILLPRQQAE